MQLHFGPCQLVLDHIITPHRAAEHGERAGRHGDSVLQREYLRAYADELASRLQVAARAGAGDSIADDVLLATAVAMIQSPGA